MPRNFTPPELTYTEGLAHGLCYGLLVGVVVAAVVGLLAFHTLF